MNSKRTWTLDSPINKNYPVKIKITSLLNNLLNFSSDYSIDGSVVSNLGFVTADTESNKNIINNIELNEFNYTLEANSTDGIITDELNNQIAKVNYDTGQIEFYIRTDPPIEGEDNIEIEFVPTDISYYDEKYIDNCAFGIQFGVEGYKDRLFLTGNQDYPNRVFYSEFNDFTYFPFTNIHDLGNDSSPVVAFSRLNDSTIAIHKKNDGIDPSIYYMTYSIDSDDTIAKYKFPVIAGVLGESPVNCDTCFNLSGDNLFLSSNGVYGIELNENIKSNERYALERSGFINSMLKKHNDLSKAKAITYNNRYYLAIDDVVYVADARHKSSARSGDMKDTFNYEWWYWTNVPVKQWVIFDNKLCFVDTKGNLNEFYDGYEDIATLIFIQGNLVVSEESQYKIAYNSAYDEIFKNSEKIMIEFFSHVEGECLPDIIPNAIISNRKYYIVDIDYYKHTFSISLDPEGNKKIKITYVIPYGMVGVIHYSNTVKSIWKTPILSLGTTLYSKNLLSSTLVFEPNIEGSVTYGYRTSDNYKQFNSSLLPETGVDFTNVDFTNFSFANTLARSRTIKTRARNFCFIEFIIKSDDDKDCAINNFTIVYNVGRKNKGVR